ncbi:MAG: GNAT family N-acetyltransferase [Ignavibacteriae bacterium]|nr:GNAT family N-acetyltransferase [Ignavibacteria bacterium]MBI3365212.1 GNAT family N-acetyltransferase [Ignavibacteriota bacterium]
MNIQPVTLEGATVTLEPLTIDHHAALCNVGLDPELWKVTMMLIRTPDDMKQYIETALQWQKDGTALPFAIVEKSSDTVVGSTRYGNIDHASRRVEIGWTWVARQWQRTYVNTETKYLLLKHAFETLGCIRVEFKTDSINERSRNALLRIGAREEGVLRNHMITPAGRIRHSVYYSIIDSEWPEVKKFLEQKLVQHER